MAKKTAMSLLFCLIGSLAGLTAQTTNAWDQTDQVMALRSALISDIRQNNRDAAQNNLNQLLSFHSDTNTALVWDERWLLYFWLGRHEAVLREMEIHRDELREQEMYNWSLPADSLFFSADQVVYQQYDQVVNQLRASTLDAENLMAAQLLLDHLLRDNSDTAKQQRQLFLNKYPHSRYESFVSHFMRLPARKPVWGFGMSGLIYNANWNGELERSLNPAWGFQGDFYITRKRLLIGYRIYSSNQKIRRDIDAFDAVWKKGSTAHLIHNMGEIGYMAFQKPKLTVITSVLLGQATLSDNNYKDGDVESFPFSYSGFEWGGSITADFKISNKKEISPDWKYKGYSAVRTRIGYSRLPLGLDQPELSGNMLFFAVGFNFYFK